MTLDTLVRPHHMQTSLDSELDIARDQYIRSHPKSANAFSLAQSYMPGGNTRTVLFHTPFPLRIVSGSGCKVEDADGLSYVNLLGEYTAGLFGHDNPVIRKAIDQALDDGVSLSGHNPNEINLARLVCDRFPSIDKVRFTNSGTEANLLAISTARYITGRKKVMVFRGGYHGGLLYFANGGIPINAPFDYTVGNYNDIAGTSTLIEQCATDLACVLVEPMQGSAGCIPGNLAFLRMLRQKCDETGAVLIFDEVMTSRLSTGGVQELTGVIPDMTTLGKYIGGGMSFGAFGGREDCMAIYDPRAANAIPHAGTFNNNTLTMAAGVAAMGKVLTEENLHRLNKLGDDLRNRLNGITKKYDCVIQVTGKGSLLGIHTTANKINSVDDLANSDDRMLELLFLDLLQAGYYIARRGFIALMLTVEQQHIDGFAEAFEQVLHNRRRLFRRQCN